MDMIKVWEVSISGKAELFDSLDVALDYMKAELRAGQPVGWIESRDMTRKLYDSLTS